MGRAAGAGRAGLPRARRGCCHRRRSPAHGIRALGLRVLPSDSTIVSYTGTSVYALADRLEARGWSVDRMHRPEAVHLTVTANHAPIVDEYLADLAVVVAEVCADPSFAKQGIVPMYGMAGKLPVRRLVARNVRKLIAEMYAP